MYEMRSKCLNLNKDYTNVIQVPDNGNILEEFIIRDIAKDLVKATDDYSRLEIQCEQLKEQIRIAEENPPPRVYLSIQDRRILDWHCANLEFANAAPLSCLSLKYWDQDDEYEFSGCHLTGVEVSVENVDDSKTFVKETYEGDAVLVTVPLGVLKENVIEFEPMLPEWKQSAIDRLGFGNLNKVVLCFEKVFWDPTHTLFAHVEASTSCRGELFLFWCFVKPPVLIALIAGEAANVVECATDDIIIGRTLVVLRNIFGTASVPTPKETIVTRWKSDPFARGSYSYVAVGASGDDYDILGRPVIRENETIPRLYFGGEHTNRNYPATVHGALLSGLREARRIADTFLGSIYEISTGMNNYTHSYGVQRVPNTPSAETSFCQAGSHTATGGQIKRIGRDIIEDLFCGKKNSVQCLNEYCSMIKKPITFTEAGCQYRYANYATIDGIQFPQGTGKSKKEAKISGARHVFAALLDLDEEAFDTKFAGMSDVKIDRHGHKIVENGPNLPEHLFTAEIVEELTRKLNELAVNSELFKSKGVAHALHRTVTGRPSSSVSASGCSEDNASIYSETSFNKARPPSVVSYTNGQGTPTSGISANQPIQNPITNLQDYCKANMIYVDIKTIRCFSDENSASNSTHAPFRSWVCLENDNTKIADVFAFTATDARRRAAQRALEALMRRQPHHIIQSKPMVTLTEYEEIANTVGDFVKHIKQSDQAQIFQSMGSRYYAAFVLKKTHRDVGKVVAFGIGSRCPDPENVTENGESLLDCHALALARRALIQYFYGELTNYANGSSIRTILEGSEKDPTKTQLKNHVSIHLLMSGAPCGDARDFLPSDTDGHMSPYDVVQMRAAGHAPVYDLPDHGHLKYKLSSGLETISADPLQRFAIMSCSDKILKWNVLGVQGALLSNLVEPIKISSVTFLSGFKQQHTSRALCCRLDKAADPVFVHHPMIGRIKFPQPQPETFYGPPLLLGLGCRIHRLDDHSYSWSQSYQGEILDAKAGRPITGGISAISKVVLLSEYKAICQKMKRIVSVESTYYSLKQSATEYHKKKKAMINFLELSKMGYWSFEKKHLEQFKWHSTIAPIVRNITV
ncbi:unnamed protein product [Didymodactylos carnosus]|uniref:Uncharacterized protein n=1 Tax=Didymodactylos carnosus TaxID=1234261 RepID=A0A814TG60_9BILA|nr:unnamed protein product [Didymodactylos carnosus]CAF3922680.1 unnamed protein product [Didymodactylos carnosus]